MTEGHFGEQLRNLREGKGMSVNQLGVYSGVSPALISKLENGLRKKPKPATIEKLAKGLKIKYEELMIIAGYYDENQLQNLPGDEKESTYALPKSEIEQFIKEREDVYGVIIRDDPVFQAALRNLVDSIAQTKVDQQKKNNPE